MIEFHYALLIVAINKIKEINKYNNSVILLF